jgi:hypothetical protein
MKSTNFVVIGCLVLLAVISIASAQKIGFHVLVKNAVDSSLGKSRLLFAQREIEDCFVAPATDNPLFDGEKFSLFGVPGSCLAFDFPLILDWNSF